MSTGNDDYIERERVVNVRFQITTYGKKKHVDKLFFQIQKLLKRAGIRVLQGEVEPIAPPISDCSQ